MKYNHYAKITRSTETTNTSSGTDYSFDDGSGQTPDPGSGTIYDNYSCKIIEKVQSYETSQQGENYTGRCVMKGMLTDKLQKGDIVDGSYKIVGTPRIVQNRETVCSLVRIN